MTGLDLTGIEDFVNAEILIDDLLITRPNGTADLELDEDDGRLFDPTPAILHGDGTITDDTPLLYDGKGAVQPLRGFTSVPDPETQKILRNTEARYRALLPMGPAGAIEFRAGDVVVVKQANGVQIDPLITKRIWHVVELGEVATLGVLRTLYLKQIATVA